MPHLSSSQTDSSADIKKQINSIKMDPGFLKAEANDSIQEQAFKTAANEVLLHVKSRYEGQGIEALSAKMLQPALKTLVYSRGAVKRVFVFLEISLVDSVAKSLGGIPPIEGGKPTVKPSTNESEYKPEPEYNAETSRPATDNEPEREDKPVADNMDASDQVSFNELIFLLCNIEMADEAARLLSQFKHEGKIKEIGQLKPGIEIPAGSILVIYNRDKQLQALLSQENGSYRNIKRDCPDQLSNYSGCGALWFR